ncbi:Rieske (2Fe-2S) protein [Streptomyces sp. H27-C3]|uniref:Rieske (2Fe-2S) protein n=1 Tax=Streptomyces sp. H27-C3 TaxID=3046305 RepID=UPI0024BA2715|nr:Rieske (2Fe-2S) protein [Streptomyces sp. H27-C3]MDJ0464619.1 Rieske (2Fe-2S) protein [Streptomyces sp. H27-C3]
MPAAGCGKYGDENSGGGDPAPEPPKPPESDPAEGGPSDEAAPADQELARTSEVPVGGGRAFGAEKVVVTQPDTGTFKALSAACTHQGRLVKTVEGGTINCPCHGSEFRVADASVVGGPVPKPLAPRRITVESDSIRLV